LLGFLRGNYRAVFLIACIPGLLSTLLILPVRERRDQTAAASRGPLFSISAARANSRLRWFLLVTLVFALGNSSDMFLILRAKQLGASSTIAVLLFAVCNLANVVSSYPAGICSDRLGRRGVLVIGFFLFGGIWLSRARAAPMFSGFCFPSMGFTWA